MYVYCDSWRIDRACDIVCKTLSLAAAILVDWCTRMSFSICLCRYSMQTMEQAKYLILPR